jgi:hypothetical protein
MAFTVNSYAYWSCAWPYRTEVNIQENSGSTLNDYQVKVTINGSDLNAAYDWTTNAFDLRVIDSDDETLLDFWVESWDQVNEVAIVWVKLSSLVANQNRTLYVYYGNEYADQLANVPFTFVEPGIKFHTRNVITNPNSLAQAQSLFDGAGDGNAGFGCTFITDFTEIENSDEFGSNYNFIAYSETYFKVESNEVGIWGIRYGSDFGGGGGLYINGITLEEDWVTDLWWDYDWDDSSEVLEGTIDLTEGYHKLEIIGQEGGDDGGITVQFQRPGDGFLSYNVGDIDIVSRACPASIEPSVSFGAHATSSCPTPIAQYRLDEGPWSVAEDVLDQTGSFPGTMLGSFSDEENSQVCSGVNINNNSTVTEISALNTNVDLDADVGPVGSIGFWIRSEQDWDANNVKRTYMDASLYVNGSASDRYFFLQKLEDGRLQFRFEDDNDSDFTITESSGLVRTQDTWYHITVTWDFPNDQFSIYDGDILIASGTPNTSGAISSLGDIYIGDNASQYNIASGNSSYASFDEVTIYNSVTSVSEIRGLMAKTRNCPTPIFTNTCDATFPDGMSSLNFGTIEFSDGAQLIDNPDTQLSANTITNGSGNSCVSTDCSAGDPIVNAVSAGSFQTTSETNDIYINNNNSTVLGSVSNEFDNVYGGRDASVTFDNSIYDTFYIDNLDFDRNATITFSAGTYWIRNLYIGRNSSINVAGGKVRIYIGNSPTFERGIEINDGGGSENLLMYFYDDVQFERDTAIEATIYGEQNIEYGRDSSHKGLVTAADLELGSDTTITYESVAYDGLDDITWCESNVVGIGSIIVSAPLTGINCLTSEVEISIFDTNGDLLTGFDSSLDLSTNVNHGDWSPNGSQLGSINNGTADDGAATYYMSSNDGGSVTLLLSNTHPELTTLTVQSEGVMQSASIDFQSAGFVFSTIPNQVSALNSSTMTLQAVETDQITGSCQSLLLNPTNVDLAVECISPNNCQSAVSTVNDNNVNTNVLNAASLSYSSVPLDFGGASSSAAPIVFNYDDAGSLRVYAKYELKDVDGVNTGNIITGTSNDFVTVPAGFCIDSLDSNWQCDSPGLGVACTAFKQAGDAFNLSVTAKQYNAGSTDYCSHNTVNNFVGLVTLSHSLISPTVADGGQTGDFSLPSINLNSGTGTASASFDEMGVFTITAGGNAYLSASLPSNHSDNFGRFYPSSFDIVSSTPAIYDNGNTGFTYTGQLESDGVTGSISYLAVPDFTFEVRGFNNQTLHNYVNPLYSSPVVSAIATSSTQGNIPSDMTLTAGFTAGTVSGPDVNDQFLYTFNMADHFVFDRTQNSLRPPFNNDIDITILSFIEPVDSVDISSSSIISGSGGPIYYGRIRIENGYGPETEPVSQLFKTEYFDGTQFLFNTLDSGTNYDLLGINSIVVTDIGYASNNLDSNDSSISGEIADLGIFQDGYFLANWSVPTGNRYGSYEFMYTVENWLKYDWDNTADGVNEDPTGTVNFGQFRGNDRVIYWKEINY